MTGSAPRSKHALTLDSSDDELIWVVQEEQACVDRVLEYVRSRARQTLSHPQVNYDAQMLELRDQIAEARLEDVPPLVERMEQLQRLHHRTRLAEHGRIDVRSPYFGRLVLEENGRRREVLIGPATSLDTRAGLRIVDWRDAPVSRLYYRYEEGDEYLETFGDRRVEGEVIARRSVAILDGGLRRVVAPQGTFQRREASWCRVDRVSALRGGQRSSTRSEDMSQPVRLGVGEEGEADRRLKAITGLIDREQFDLITLPDSGLVVIQGGAGSGKTTIGLHRLAYLGFHNPRRFAPGKMLVVVFNRALARYIAGVLPALGVNGVAVRTYAEWAERLRRRLHPELKLAYSEETPQVVQRLKQHPLMLHAIDAYVDKLQQEISTRMRRSVGERAELLVQLENVWKRQAGRPLAHQLHGVSQWVQKTELPIRVRHAFERELKAGLRRAQDVLTAWAELLTDKSKIARAVLKYAPGEFLQKERGEALRWCAARSFDVFQELERQEQRELDGVGRSRCGERPEDVVTVDGRKLIEEPTLDREDDTLLLRLAQRMRGPLLRPNGKEALVFEHLLVDEAQDLSPVELAVLMGTVSRGQSVTLAGDVAQRVRVHNGFTSWASVLSMLGLRHVAVQPLQISYRSNREIVEFSQAVLGPLAPETPPVAVRCGVPVEAFAFSHIGDAVRFLAEQLHRLLAAEPGASVAVIARYPEQAQLYYEGLKNAEVVNLRRVAEQDFSFRPGVDVTDVYQVKGLEFDYVVMTDVTDASYPVEEEARHLLHIAATRAAHQLWLLTSSRPSELLPEGLRATLG